MCRISWDRLQAPFRPIGRYIERPVDRKIGRSGYQVIGGGFSEQLIPWKDLAVLSLDQDRAHHWKEPVAVGVPHWPKPQSHALCSDESKRGDRHFLVRKGWGLYRRGK
jgi:hypothetical protein